MDMWNKLFTNQGTLLEPLLKELRELVADRPDTEEIEQLDREIHNLSEQSRILNQKKENPVIQKAEKDKRNRPDGTAYRTACGTEESD